MSKCITIGKQLSVLRCQVIALSVWGNAVTVFLATGNQHAASFPSESMAQGAYNEALKQLESTK